VHRTALQRRSTTRQEAFRGDRLFDCRGIFDFHLVAGGNRSIRPFFLGSLCNFAHPSAGSADSSTAVSVADTSGAAAFEGSASVGSFMQSRSSKASSDRIRSLQRRSKMARHRVIICIEGALVAQKPAGGRGKDPRQPQCAAPRRRQWLKMMAQAGRCACRLHRKLTRRRWDRRQKENATPGRSPVLHK
jgi:hypothetical protein